MRPSPAVLASFGAGADPSRCPAARAPPGDPARWCSKSTADPRAACWTADLYLSLSGHQDPGFRVPRPLRSATGDWIAPDLATGDLPIGTPAGTPAGAWVAWQWLPGEPTVFGQLLARALVYRLVTEVIFRRGDPAGLAAAARAGQHGPVLIAHHVVKVGIICP